MAELVSLVGSALVCAVMYALFVRPLIDMYQDAQKKKAKRPSAREIGMAQMRERAAEHEASLRRSAQAGPSAS